MVAAAGQDHRGARQRIDDHLAVEAEDVADQLVGDHVARDPDGVDPALADGDELVGVASGEVEVVEHHDDGGAPGAVQIGQQVEHLDLVGDVEEAGRLVEQEDVGLLGERHRDPHPLALTAGQLVDRAVGEVGGLGRVERGGDRLVVGASPRCECTLVRVTAAPDEVGDGDALGGDRALRQQTEDAGDLLGTAVADVLPVEQDLAGCRDEQSGERAQQGRLAAPVGADDGGDPSGATRSGRATRRRHGRRSRASTPRASSW